MLRPVFQVSIKVKIKMPITKGTQPPSGIFNTLALKKATSTTKNKATSMPVRNLLQPQM